MSHSFADHCAIIQVRVARDSRKPHNRWPGDQLHGLSVIASNGASDAILLGCKHAYAGAETEEAEGNEADCIGTVRPCTH